MATGNTARVYNLPVGFIEPGRSADVALIDAPIGSVASSALELFAIGDSPAVGMVMIDGLLSRKAKQEHYSAATQLQAQYSLIGVKAH